MSYNGRGRGGYSANTNNNRNTSSFQNTGVVEVEITGWNGATATECIGFISRKCKVTVTNYTVNNNVMRGFVNSQKDADNLIQWSGVRFAGAPLKMHIVKNAFASNGAPGQAPAGDDGAIETLNMFLKLRYNPQIKLLNLSSVQQDPTLISKGFFGSLSTSSKFFPALMKIAGNLKLDVTSADLSGNNLSDLTSISALAQTFPTLQNLLLQNNNFSRIKAFETWRKKLNFLRELILVGNPLLNNQAEALNIKLELMKNFPRLVVLNGEVVRNEQALLANLSFPFELPRAMFFQDAEVQSISTNFITNYYNLWDTNRADLMVLYQNESQFSLQVDLTQPHIVDANKTPDFGYYIPLSRNLTRISSSRARMTRVAQGQEQIYKLFTQIPKTRHDLMSKPDNYSMESFRLAQLGAISITLHGNFEETGPPDNTELLNPQSGPGRNKYAQLKKEAALGSKCFDRTFIVIPGPNASMIVASDMICLRAEVSPEAFKGEAATAIQPAAPQLQPLNPGTASPQAFNTPPPGAAGVPTAADLPAEVKANLNPAQQEILVRILLETKLNIQYGVLLCQQSNWDYQQSSINFKTSAASLPPDAFAQ